MKWNFNVRRYLNERLPDHFREDDRGWLLGACLWHKDGKRGNLGINSETGGYRCLSCNARGGLISLVQRVEGFVTYEEAQAWLDEIYGVDNENTPFELFKDVDLSVRPATVWQPPDESILSKYEGSHSYLEEERMITKEWQQLFGIGFDQGAISFPWRDRRGTLMTIKLRSVFSKKFWYDPKVPYGVKKALLYGIDQVALGHRRTVWITEAEIDALSLWQSGRPAVALGGSLMSKEQASELILTGVSRVILACDRDEAGKVAQDSVREQLYPYGIEVLDAAWPEGFAGKDVNELLKVGRIDELDFECSDFFSLG